MNESTFEKILKQKIEHYEHMREFYQAKVREEPDVHAWAIYDKCNDEMIYELYKLRLWYQAEDISERVKSHDGHNI